MRLLIGICALVLALGIATSVYAETQSVKISGDLCIRGIGRRHYSIGQPVPQPVRRRSPLGQTVAANTGQCEKVQTWVMSTTEVQIDADLTDNVSAVIRLGNQRDWGASNKDIVNQNSALGAFGATNGRAGYALVDDDFDVGIDVAYIELKEFLYSPLTLRIGRQDLWFGKGFIVGANQIVPNVFLGAPEYTIYDGFDAIRATLDYDPWTIDVIGAKIWENAIGHDDDVNLYGTNVGYMFDVYNAEAETYYFLKWDESVEAWQTSHDNVVNTTGIRGSFDPIENWTLAGETAYQWGRYIGARQLITTRDRSAWALDISAECRHFADQYAWKPIIGAEYIFYSGDRNAATVDANAATPGVLGNITGIYTGWDPMFRGKFDSAYREFIGRYYATQDFPMRANCLQSYADASFTNQHQALVYGSIQPTDSLTLDGRIIGFWLDEKISTIRTKKYVGAELDLELTWDYTEDVSFGLLGAWFVPGGLYEDDENIVTDVVGSVKLSF